ncbi:MAG TPA: hypothetical protein VEJ21_04865 [Acidimicrobiales bacterium]|nr:hypothetical protein [Acidimicrobiales bacterium]
MDDTADQDPVAGGEASPAKPLGIIVTFVVFVAVVALVITLLSLHAYRSPAGVEVAKPIGTTVVDGVTVPHVTLSMATYPDAAGTSDGAPVHPGGNPSWPSYGHTNQFQVPAHALVTVTVTQYDSGGSLNNPWFAIVQGTVGDVMSVDGRTVHSLDPNDVAHTFTVRGSPGTDPGFFLNVPLPAVGGNDQSDNGPHHTVVFSFMSGSKGLYVWNCEYPCGTGVAGFGGPMSIFGYMSGYLHVV